MSKFFEKLMFYTGVLATGVVAGIFIYINMDLSHPNEKTITGQVLGFTDGWTGSRNVPRYFSVRLEDDKEVKISVYQGINKSYRGEVEILRLEKEGRHTYRIIKAIN